jgi:hypothetical protein
MAQTTELPFQCGSCRVIISAKRLTVDKVGTMYMFQSINQTSINL